MPRTRSVCQELLSCPRPCAYRILVDLRCEAYQNLSTKSNSTARKIGKYRLMEKTLGTGATICALAVLTNGRCAGQFCIVKLGWCEGRRVALKIVKPKWAKQDSDAINEMVSVGRSALADGVLSRCGLQKMLRRVQHPNVIRLLDAQLMVQCPKQSGGFFETDMLVLELAEATLSEILYNTGPFEENFVRLPPPIVSSV